MEEQIYITEKQRRELNKKVFREFYDKKRRYSIDDVMESYEVTNVPQELIKKELDNIVEKDKYYAPKKKEKILRENEYLLKSEAREDGDKNKIEKSSKLEQIVSYIGAGFVGIVRGIFEHLVILPTALRKDFSSINEDDIESWETKELRKKSIQSAAYLSTGGPILGWVIDPIVAALSYSTLSKYNPEIVPYIAIAQIATNVISLGYEIIRYRINKKKE